MEKVEELNIIIDIETTSTLPNASILTFAAIKFNPNDEKEYPMTEMDTFYRRIDQKSCDRLGLHTSQNTLDWWQRQDAKTRYEAFEQTPRYPLKQVLTEFGEWFGGKNDVGRKGFNGIVWARGTNFDPVILENAYRQLRLPVPWKFWLLRDVRTLLHIFPVDSVENIEGHHALHDCYRDCILVKRAMGEIRSMEEVINLYVP